LAERDGRAEHPRSREEASTANHHAGVHLIQVPDGKSVKNRVHLDLVPTDRRRDDEIDRVVALGATTLADRRNADGTGWVTLGDPEGNEFCIVRSDMERREHTA
jgi:Glyoxalase-like domain